MPRFLPCDACQRQFTVLQLQDCPFTYRGLCWFCFEQDEIASSGGVPKPLPRHEDDPEYVVLEIEPWAIRLKYKWWDRIFKYYEKNLLIWAWEKHHAEKETNVERIPEENNNNNL